MCRLSDIRVLPLQACKIFLTIMALSEHQGMFPGESLYTDPLCGEGAEPKTGLVMVLRLWVFGCQEGSFRGRGHDEP